MKRFTALWLALLLAVAAVGASAASPTPFDGLEDYFVDYDDMDGTVWVEYTNLPALVTEVNGWPVYATLAFYSYESDGRWYAMLQAYFGMDNTEIVIDKMIVLVDGVRYTLTGEPSMDTGGNYTELMVPIGQTALQMLEAMSTTGGEVKVRFSTADGNLDFNMTDIQLQAMADLYHAYAGSSFYDAGMLYDIDFYYPVTVADAPTPFLADSAPPATVPEGGAIDTLWDIPLGSMPEQAAAIVQQQFGVTLELNDSADTGAPDGEVYYPMVVTLMSPYGQPLSLLGKPVDAVLYFKENSFFAAGLQVLGDTYGFADEDAGADADARAQRLEEALAYFDLLTGAYGAPQSAMLRTYEDIAPMDWSFWANPQYTHEASALTDAGALDGDALRAALRAHSNLRVEVRMGSLLATMTCGSMTPGKPFAINMTLDFDYEDAANQAAPVPKATQAPQPAASTGGYTAAELAALEGYRTLSVGMRGEDVLRLKERMYELGYFKNPSANSQYTETTAEYVNEFLRNNGVANPDGTMTPEQQLLFYSDRAIAKPKPITYDRLAYKDVARSAEQYVGQRWKITTYVVQQIDDASSSDVRLVLSADRRGNQIIYAQVPGFKNWTWGGDGQPVTRLLQGDKVEIFCEILGEYSYETISGKWLTVPLVSVVEMNLYY